MPTEVGGDEDERHDDRQRVGRCGSRPDAVQPPKVGAEVKRRNQEQHLPRQTQEDGQRDFADGLEVVACHNLEAHERIEREHETHAGLGDADQRLVLREQAGQNARHGFHAEETERRNGGGHLDGEEQRLPHAVHTGRAEIIAHDGLHGVAQAEREHDEQDGVAVDDAVGAYREVAAVGIEAVVEDDVDDAGGRVHQKGRQAYRNDILHDMPLDADIPPMQPDIRLGAQEIAHREIRAHEHGDNRGPGRAADAHAEAENEQRVEHEVAAHAYEHDAHVFLG